MTVSHQLLSVGINEIRGILGIYKRDFRNLSMQDWWVPLDQPTALSFPNLRRLSSQLSSRAATAHPPPVAAPSSFPGRAAPAPPSAAPAQLPRHARVLLRRRRLCSSPGRRLCSSPHSSRLCSSRRHAACVRCRPTFSVDYCESPMDTKLEFSKPRSNPGGASGPDMNFSSYTSGHRAAYGYRLAIRFSLGYETIWFF
jgi:hypothetical protein